MARTGRYGGVVRGCGCVAALSALLALTACGSGIANPALFDSKIQPVNASFYTLDGKNGRLLTYQVVNSAAKEGAPLQLPAGMTPLLVATDAAGQVYVGGYTTADANVSEVLVYAANSGPGSTPLRTVTLEYGRLTALTVDAEGQIYAGQTNTLAAVKVYAATANGASSAMRVLNPTHFQYLNDIAVDAANKVYVSGWNGGAYFIDAYAAGAAGAATPLTTLYAPSGSYFGGICVDGSGNLWAMEQLTIVEFAPGASGTPTPMTAINLPGPVAPYISESYSNVLRRDSSGDLYVPMTMYNSALQSSNGVYAYQPNQSGNATPALAVTLGDATETTPLGINVPLAVQ